MEKEEEPEPTAEPAQEPTEASAEPTQAPQITQQPEDRAATTNGVKAAFSIVLLLTKIQKGFIKFLEPAVCGNDFSNML